MLSARRNIPKVLVTGNTRALVARHYRLGCQRLRATVSQHSERGARSMRVVIIELTHVLLSVGERMSDLLMMIDGGAKGRKCMQLAPPAANSN